MKAYEDYAINSSQIGLTAIPASMLLCYNDATERSYAVVINHL